MHSKRKDISHIIKRSSPFLYRIMLPIYALIYWMLIYLININGYVNIHFIRHGIYRYVFKLDLGKSSIIYCGCRFFEPWGIHIGNNSIIGDHAFLDGRSGLYIGNNVNIAGDVRIYTLEHDIASPTFAAIGGPIRIEDWAYIGSRVMILPNTIIKEGAVIASGAVVTKNVDAWTVVGGIPAKLIKNRPVVRYTLDTKHRSYFQ